MKHRISIPETAERFDYEAKETDMLWDMVKMLENKFQTTHHFISIYQDRYLSQKLSYGCYASPLSVFTNTKWYITLAPDRVRLFNKKYVNNKDEKMIYDFTDFEEIIHSDLDNVLYQVTTNPLHQNRMIEIHFSLRSHEDIRDLFYLLPKMMYSYDETDEMGKTRKIRPTYHVVKISIDQTEQKLTDRDLQTIHRMIRDYEKETQQNVTLSL